MRALIFGCGLIGALAIIAPGARAESPQNLYLLNCWGCHRANGEGIAGTAPPLRDAADFLRVKGGREYLIEVPGVAESALTDAQVAEVMNWVIQNFSRDRVPADFTPYTAEEVHRSRETRVLDIAQRRESLVRAMAAHGIRE